MGKGFMPIISVLLPRAPQYQDSEEIACPKLSLTQFYLYAKKGYTTLSWDSQLVQKGQVFIISKLYTDVLIDYEVMVLDMVIEPVGLGKAIGPKLSKKTQKE